MVSSAQASSSETRERIIKKLRIEPGAKANLAGRDTRWTGGGEFEQLSAAELDATAKAVLARGVERLKDAQELLWASGSYALLIVFQAMDAAGKDSTIKHVMSGVNPRGVQVVSFKQPSSEELDHAFLWRISKAAPERGRIGIFNRSHYEEVVALRVHPEWLDKGEYVRAYEDAITATSTDWAPWYVIPADNKHVMQALVAAIIVDTIGCLDLHWPKVDEDRDANARARLDLEAESDD